MASDPAFGGLTVRAVVGTLTKFETGPGRFGVGWVKPTMQRAWVSPTYDSAMREVPVRGGGLTFSTIIEMCRSFGR